MAELVVRSQCRSAVRKVADASLNVTFPVWGIAAPIAVVVLLVLAGTSLSNHAKVLELLAYAALCLSIASICVLVKRALLKDLMIVDNQGIQLPHLLGSSVRLKSYLPWSSVSTVKAIARDSDLSNCDLIIELKRGRPVHLRAGNLEPELLEQFALATKMWAPDAYDASLENLQELIRTGARQQDHASYTNLWEEELARRFNPAAYIPLEPGRVLRNSSVKIVSHLASGGLSALYLCQLDGKELVVLKEAVIPENSAENVREKARELFEREAHLLMKLDHPGIVHVRDCFTEGGRNYLLLDYVSGSDLNQVVKQNGAQAEPDVLQWAIQIANALKYLHERDQPIIHRDLTPDNIVLRNDQEIVIVDFGAANEYIGNATGTFVGKQAYIAPEQLRGKATIHSDIYAFGCTLFFLLTGTEPEALSTSNPRSLNPSVSEGLAELVQSCTQLEAGDRYQSIAQLLPVLRRLSAQSVVV
jgi:serine/threonine protein kinase